MGSLLRRTLVGEYACLALVLNAVIGAVVSVGCVTNPALMIVYAAAACWTIGRAVGAFAQQAFSPPVSVAFCVAVLALGPPELSPPSRFWSVILQPAFVGMLLVVIGIDVLELVMSRRGAAVRRWLRRLNWRRTAVWGGLAMLASYLVLVPTVSLVIEQLRPTVRSGPVPEMSLAEQVRLRTTEAITALIFFSFGAAVGSFLNVVAYRAPRGVSVAFQRSRCPTCGAQISGRDNVPIVGWLLLNGRCRDCQSPISVRYPAVETIAASLFLLLYFIELISGGANIPERRPNYHNGVVWILLYTKWDLVGLYLFHCFALCSLLTWSLIDIDRRRVPRWILATVLSVLGVVPFIWPDLLPVGWSRFGGSGATAPDWLSSAEVGTGVIGGLAGALLGWVTAAATSGRRTGESPPADRSDESSVPPGGHAVSAGLIVGLSLGWQAAVGVWLLTLASRPIVAWAVRRAGAKEPPITAIVLAACFVQLIAWRLTTVAWWPSSQTTPVMWAVVVVVLAALWAINRAIPRQVIQRAKPAHPATTPVLEIGPVGHPTPTARDPTDG